ncbi:MAG: class I fructose-bisphosphate aldolase [Nitratireductor sp.]
MSERIQDIAQKLVANGQGILAADESTGTIQKRFDSINVENTEQNRRDYRQMLFTTEDAMRDYISGVILFEETLFQKTEDGTPLVEIMKAAGSIPGIKVDRGAHALPGSSEEKVTEGLDGLRDRLQKYHAAGARFAKWRAVINISKNTPTNNCTKANTHALARYAALCQENGIVPIVEPEVVMDGPNSTHTIDRCAEVTAWALDAQFAELRDAGVDLEGMILKPNMIVPGQNCPTQASIDEVAEKTVRCFKNHVPAVIPGIAFLSGGQSDELATAHLSAMNAQFDLPWQLTFSYGRALQAAALKAWGGKTENVAAAQRAFRHRAKMNAMAATGSWQKALEKAA